MKTIACLLSGVVILLFMGCASIGPGTVNQERFDDTAVLKRVVENAKAYFKEPRKFDQAWKEEVGDEE